MGLKITQNDNLNIDLIPPGTYVARCYMIADLGWHDNDYQGHVIQQRKVRLAFETPDVLIEEGEFKGKPYTVSVELTLSLSEKSNLYSYLQSWRGKEFTQEELEGGFELFDMLDKPCMVTVIHKTSKAGRKYQLITGITQLPKGVKCPDLSIDPVVFSLDDVNWEENMSKLPDWLQKKIKVKAEHVARSEQQPDNSSEPPSWDDEDVPY